MKEVTDSLDQTHLFLPKSVVIICKDENRIIDHVQIHKSSDENILL